MEIVICLGCGYKFKCEQDGAVITPSTCPNCNSKIINLKQTKSDYKTAIVT